jgi:hypothetical protein
MSAAGAGGRDLPIFVRAADGRGAPSFPHGAADVLTRGVGGQSGAEVTLRFCCCDRPRGDIASHDAARLTSGGAAR